MAQVDKDMQKKFDKAQKLLDKSKWEDARKVLLDYAKANPLNGDIWDQLASNDEQAYLSNRKLFGSLSQNLSVTIKDSSGTRKPDPSDTSVQKLMAMLKDFDFAASYKETMLNDCELACLHTIDAMRCSIYLRIYGIDKPVTDTVPPDAKTAFDHAEEEFGQSNYSQAEKYYGQAIGIDSGYYQALLYLGDTYYQEKDYINADRYYQKACSLHPERPEAYKYLSDSYLHQGLYGKSAHATVQAMLLYPDFSLLGKWMNANYKQQKQYNLHWISRPVAVNKPGAKGDAAPSGSPWKYYQEAMKQMEPYCDSAGLIVKPNSLSGSKYLEVYCWEYMLSKSSDKQFDYARKMQERGMLDCYVMVVNFQYGFYRQFRDFSDHNRERIENYFQTVSELKD